MRGYRFLTFMLAMVITGALAPQTFTLPAVLILGVVGVVLLGLDTIELGIGKPPKD